LIELDGKLEPLEEEEEEIPEKNNFENDNSLFMSMDVYDDQVRDMLDHLDDVEVIECIDELGNISIPDENIPSKADNDKEEIKQPESDSSHPDEKPVVSTEELPDPPTQYKETPVNTEIKSLKEYKKNKKPQFKKVIVILTTAGVLTISAVVIMNNNSQKQLNDIKPPTVPSTSINTGTSISTTTNQAPDAHPKTKVKNDKNSKDQPSTSKNDITSRPKNVNDVLTKAFMQDGDEIKISNISWEVGSSLANNSIFKNYLIVTGQTYKTALSKALLSAKERAKNDHIKVNLKLDLNGNIRETIIKESSGSKQIDEIILQTLKEILGYTKLPKIQTKKTYIKASIMINL